MEKISSVLELARYKIGETAWWVTMRFHQRVPELCEEDEWMLDVHPKTLYENLYKPTWPFRCKFPKLHHADFNCLVTVLSSQFVVEPFEIHEIYRSDNTGEFFYSNPDDEWMPESYLCDTREAAIKERNRILSLVNKWLKKLK